MRAVETIEDERDRRAELESGPQLRAGAKATFMLVLVVAELAWIAALVYLCERLAHAF